MDDVHWIEILIMGPAAYWWGAPKEHTVFFWLEESVLSVSSLLLLCYYWMYACTSLWTWLLLLIKLASYVAVLWCPLDVWWCTSIILSSMCDVAMRTSKSDSSVREENPTVIIIIIKVGSFPFACLVVWIMCYVDVTVYSGSYKCMRDCIIFLQTNESA